MNAAARTAVRGSGPAQGFLEVSDAYRSSKAVPGFGSSRPTDFIFDPHSQRFIMGSGPLGHDSILQAAGIAPSETIVGGRIYRQGGTLVTDEFSGHYGQNWTSEIRQQFQSFMQQHGVDITHIPWGP
jgi:filamentous hemagglutinin